MLVAALSTCHMLSYLHMATVAGVVVTAYADAAEGTMATEGDGGRFVEVVLRPVVTIRAASDPGKAEAAHARSGEHTSELQSLMRHSYAGFCLQKTHPFTHYQRTTDQLRNAHT